MKPIVPAIGRKAFATRNFTVKLLLTFVTMLVFASSVFSEANYVYHERTTNNPGCGSNNYVNILAPDATQPVTIAWKVEFQNYTNQQRVYYTTDGSTPTGNKGIPSGTTQVLTGAYSCTFVFSGNTIDIGTATIPAQAGGATVKYIIGAWHSGGGDEIFANGPGSPCSGCGTVTNASAKITL